VPCHGGCIKAAFFLTFPQEKIPALTDAPYPRGSRASFAAAPDVLRSEKIIRLQKKKKRIDVFFGFIYLVSWIKDLKCYDAKETSPVFRSGNAN